MIGMWTECCHYGSENVSFKADANNQLKCPHCGKMTTLLLRNPFNFKSQEVRERRTKEPPPKKFRFDQKGGRDIEEKGGSGALRSRDTSGIVFEMEGI